MNLLLKILISVAVVFVIASILIYKNSQNPKYESKKENIFENATPIGTTTKTETPVIDTKTFTITPVSVMPGEPILITLENNEIAEIYFDNKKLKTFIYKDKTRAIFPVTFEEKNLNHKIKVIFENSEIQEKPITLTPRPKIERPLGIPEKLGGNTPEASKNIVNNLAIENATLVNIKTEPEILWKEDFALPVATLYVTDDYGYNRDTVGNTIAHKGTDMRAQKGTLVTAMNDGVVRIAKTYVVYGNSVVIDHGLGVQTLYMHLSELNVKEGDKVIKGQMIGKSGDTGYAESPHLHISVKIDGVSIDPMKFLNLF